MSTASPFRRALCAAAFVFAPLASANAQNLAPGTRIRVKSPQVIAPVTGSFQGMRRDTLVVIEDDASAQVWTFTTATIDLLEVSDGLQPGHRGPMVRYGLYGAGGGALAGWIVAVALEGASSSEYNDWLSAGVGALFGAGVGVAYGYRKLAERWTVVPIPRRVGVLPTRGGVRLSYSASF
jgi:hypothetical protein